MHGDANQFVSRTKISQQANQPPKHVDNCQYELSPKQQLALKLILDHSIANNQTEPLYMLLQGTAGTGKSYLINCIRMSLQNTSPHGLTPILVLAPTGIAAFNIHATTIHVALKIPIREMKPLQGQTLTTYQEKM